MHFANIFLKCTHYLTVCNKIHFTKMHYFVFCITKKI